MVFCTEDQEVVWLCDTVFRPRRAPSVGVGGFAEPRVEVRETKDPR